MLQYLKKAPNCSDQSKKRVLDAIIQDPERVTLMPKIYSSFGCACLRTTRAVVPSSDT